MEKNTEQMTRLAVSFEHLRNMVLSTIAVGAAVTPTVVKTNAEHPIHSVCCTSHTVTCQVPQSQRAASKAYSSYISYDEGLSPIQQFLHYTSLYNVKDLQAFTSAHTDVYSICRFNQSSYTEMYVLFQSTGTRPSLHVARDAADSLTSMGRFEVVENASTPLPSTYLRLLPQARMLCSHRVDAKLLCPNATSTTSSGDIIK